MKKLIAILLAGLIALSSLSALSVLKTSKDLPNAINVGLYAQTTSRVLKQSDNKGYNVTLTGFSLTFQKNLLGDFGLSGELGLSFGLAGKIDGETFPTRKITDITDYNASFAITYIPYVGGDVYLYFAAHLTWNTTPLQTAKKTGWDRTTFHSLSGGCSAGFLARGKNDLSDVHLSLAVSYDWALTSFRTTRHKEGKKTSFPDGGWIDASGRRFSLSAGVIFHV